MREEMIVGDFGIGIIYKEPGFVEAQISCFSVGREQVGYETTVLMPREARGVRVKFTGIVAQIPGANIKEFLVTIVSLKGVKSFFDISYGSWYLGRHGTTFAN